MNQFIINVIIWSFSIYGMIEFARDIWLDFTCYILKSVKNLLIKVKGKDIISDDTKRRGEIIGNKRADR